MEWKEWYLNRGGSALKRKWKRAHPGYDKKYWKHWYDKHGKRTPEKKAYDDWYYHNIRAPKLKALGWPRKDR
jgi:hypothetical protein